MHSTIAVCIHRIILVSWACTYPWVPSLFHLEADRVGFTDLSLFSLSKILVWNILSSLFLTAELNKILTAFRKIVFNRVLCYPFVRSVPFPVLGDNPSTTCSIYVLISVKISRLQTLLSDTAWVLAFQRLVLLFTGRGIWNGLTPHEKKRTFKEASKSHEIFTLAVCILMCTASERLMSWLF